MNKRLFFLSLCFIFATVTLAQPGIEFEEIAWTDALEKAADSNKLVFLSAYVDWSEPCEEIEKYTYTDEEVGEFYNENFINIRMDMEAFPGVELAEYYNIYAFPALLFVNQEGEAVHRGCGALNSNEFLKLGKTALGDSRLIDYHKRFTDGERSPAFIADYSLQLEEACVGKQDIINRFYEDLPQKEWIDEASWTMINLNVTDPFSEPFQYLMSYHDLFAMKYGKDTVDQKIYDVLLSQFIDIYDGNDFTLFAIQALRNLMDDLDFKQKEELSSMVNMKYADLTENWDLYADNVLKVVAQQEVTNPEQLNEFAWKFYLFIEDKQQLEQAKNWMEQVLEDYADATYLDTYASLLYKLGEQKDAVNYAERALQAAEVEEQDLMHYEAQLEKFESGY